MYGINNIFYLLITNDRWNGNRERIFKWLEQEVPSLSELYRGAVITLNADIPGKTRLVSHAVREIRNRLPEETSGEKTKYLQYKNEMDEILEKWESEGLPLGGSIPISMAEEETSNDVRISEDLFRFISIFLDKYKRTRQTVWEKQKLLFKRLNKDKPVEPILPIIKDWLNLTEWFVGKAHDSGRMDHDYDLEKFKRKFERFEDFLLAFANEFFENKGVLDDILEKANS